MSALSWSIYLACSSKECGSAHHQYVELTRRHFAWLESSPFLDRLNYLFSMLSQFNNESQNRIRRSKSATSVKERRKHPIVSAPQDPESARVHAVIAAHRAMDRSRAPTSEDLRRSDGSASKQSARYHYSQHAEPATPAAQLRHQRSILQATTPSLLHSLPRTGEELTGREGSVSFVHTTMSDFGDSFEGERSSYRRLRKARSVLDPSRG